MKIAFVGAQGTGKTTLVNKLKLAMPWMHVYDEVVRTLATNPNVKINKEGDDYSQDLITLTHLRNAQEASYAHKYSLFDRCIIDSHAYAMQCMQDGFVSSVSVNYSSRIMNAIFNTFPFDLIIYIPPYKEFLKEDGVRDTDSEYQEKISIHMKNTIHVLKNSHPDLNVVELETIGIDERIKEIKDYLEETGKIDIETKEMKPAFIK
jgi:nicotinamide riboside kinase|tara:strand:- start:2158 stop:2775 length:618 start_codon:yes stop_codon:yes gene_type:complete